MGIKNLATAGFFGVKILDKHLKFGVLTKNTILAVSHYDPVKKSGSARKIRSFTDLDPYTKKAHDALGGIPK